MSLIHFQLLKKIIKMDYQDTFRKNKRAQTTQGQRKNRLSKAVEQFLFLPAAPVKRQGNYHTFCIIIGTIALESTDYTMFL